AKASRGPFTIGRSGRLPEEVAAEKDRILEIRRRESAAKFRNLMGGKSIHPLDKINGARTLNRLSWGAKRPLDSTIVQSSSEVRARTGRLPPYSSMEGRLVLAYLVYFLDGSQYKPWCKFWPTFYELFKWYHFKNIRSFAGKVETVFVDKDALVKHAKIIYSIHPHGVMSMCHPHMFFTVPHKTCKLAASACYKIPLMREAYLWSGMIDAGRPTCMKALEQGYSLTLVLGGTREQLISYSPTHDTALCKSRKGFVKLARDAGRVPIVPCYGFGESIAYETSNFLLSFRRWLQRRFGIGWAIAKSWRPKPVKDFAVVIGAPIVWDDNDTVETMHAKYIAALKDLFYDHRGRYPEYAERELIIK
ncbi:hypothetical protein FOL47_007423, partial [Perkinsus chesapeaki]